MTTIAHARISVVIPVYNGARYLGAALDSVLGQTRPPDEVVVVDDGSTDATPAVMASYGTRIVAVRQENRGGAAATNRGIGAATGEVLAFLDADDLWLPGKLALQLAALATTDAAFGHIVQFISPDLPPERAATMHCPSAPQPGLCKTAMTIRRAAFDRVGGFDETLSAVDFVDWYPKAIEAGLRMAMLPEVVARRRIHDSNNGVRLRDAQRSGNVDAIKRALDRRRARASNGRN